MEPLEIFGEMLIAIQTRIADTVPEIKYVNMDLGQLEVYALDSPSVNWPCLLIDFNDTTYADLHGGLQEADAMMMVRLGFNPYSQTSNLQPEDVRRKGLAYFAIESKVHAALHGWQPLKESGKALCQPFSRRRATTERREEDAFRVRMLGFTYGFMDDGASPVKLKQKANLDIQHEI
jgi:hypothetical protein